MAGALAWNGCDNGLSRLTANVLAALPGKEPVLRRLAHPH